MYAKPAIKKVSDLKGKIVSIGGSKDVTLIYMEFLPGRWRAQSQGRRLSLCKGDPGPLRRPGVRRRGCRDPLPARNLRAASQGFTYLGDITDHLKNFPFAVYAANTDWAAKNRPAMLGYVKAYSRGLRWVYDTNNKEKAVDILVKYSKQDRKDTVDTYDYFITKLRHSARTA